MLDRNKIAVYTTLTILRSMRERLGMEAMVAFLDNYVLLIEKCDPCIKEAVNDELRDRALSNLYQVLCDDGS